MSRRICLTICTLGLLSLPLPAAPQKPLPETVRFNRDIRPILADNCFACHGPDKNKRKADLRLNVPDDVFGDRGGDAILVPGKPEKSELYRRITAATKHRMPPAKFGKRLTAREVALIERWIRQGAHWEKHWSFITAHRSPVPAVHDRTWPRNAIDNFVLARLEEERLKPSPEADRRTLIRRLSFDLTGLPPTPAEVDAFMADRSPDDYEHLVDRLLRSPNFGERMALYWLDLVRYADTGGYHSDNHRDVWLYRDYVIHSFNENKRFDLFTTEQLAGDQWPHPTREPKIASGYNRMLMTTEEGGAQPKEYLAKYAADRVRNISTVWLGLTMACCECHDHKFDPIKTREFYEMEAFFADLSEIAVGRQVQTPMPTAEQAGRLHELDEQLATLHRKLDAPSTDLSRAQAAWEKTRPKGLPRPVADALAAAPGKRSKAQRDALTAYYRTIAPALAPLRKQLADVEHRRQALVARIPTTLISVTVPPRTIRLLPRGNWQDESGPVVQPGVPGSLPPLHVPGRRATRLDLAHWLTAPDNPLVARVFVNRLWQLMFGQGIVKTPDDFGSQGAWPTHPELLDWLAVEFRESGWNVKHMMKLMAMSATYRQSSEANEKLLERDPDNLLLARQGRFRLEAEMIRDNALAVSGLLADQLGGPSVKPYQPAGYWAYLNFPTRTYHPDHGANQYRRGLYTYWQRTFLHPSLLAFDAPSREECTVERPRSNTPLQALVLLNDPTYVEAARTLAEAVLRRGGHDATERIRYAYLQVLDRPATPDEVRILTALERSEQSRFQKDPRAATAFVHVGFRPVPTDLDTVELASWTSITRVILNLHETVTRD